MSIDLGVTNKFYWVGNFGNVEFINEDQWYLSSLMPLADSKHQEPFPSSIPPFLPIHPPPLTWSLCILIRHSPHSPPFPSASVQPFLKCTTSLFVPVILFLYRLQSPLNETLCYHPQGLYYSLLIERTVFFWDPLVNCVLTKWYNWY